MTSTSHTLGLNLIVTLRSGEGSVDGGLQGGDGGSIGRVYLGLEGSQESISVGLELLDIGQDEGSIACGGDDGGLKRVS